MSALLVAVVIAACGGSKGHQVPTGSRNAGRSIEYRLEAGWNQYKFEDEPTMADQLASAIRHEPTLTQVAAIEATFEYAQGLTFKQRLIHGDENRLLAAMEARFPSTRPILEREVAH